MNNYYHCRIFNFVDASVSPFLASYTGESFCSSLGCHMSLFYEVLLIITLLLFIISCYCVKNLALLLMLMVRWLCVEGIFFWWWWRCVFDDWCVVDVDVPSVVSFDDTDAANLFLMLFFFAYFIVFITGWEGGCLTSSLWCYEDRQNLILIMLIIHKTMYMVCENMCCMKKC